MTITKLFETRNTNDLRRYCVVTSGLTAGEAQQKAVEIVGCEWDDQELITVEI